MSGVKMKLLLLLVFGWICSETDAQTKTYLVVAPLHFRLDALERVVVQLFGFSESVTVEVSLRKTRGDNPIRRQQVTLSADNNHMGEVQLRLYPGDVDDEMKNVILHVQSATFQNHISVSLSRTNGFLVVQTDKPLYTPRQKVKVRAFSLNQELAYANRNVFLTFRDPDLSKVAVMEVKDVSNGMPSLQNPFKIPLNPKLGIWTLEASYMEHFDTLASTTFEVREYVLPTFTILIEPVYNYVSYNNFENFRFKVSAKYLHGAPVISGETIIRYGFVSGKLSPVIIPSSISLHRLTSTGEVDVPANLTEIFAKHSGPKTLSELKDKFLYITVMIQEASGGISEEAELRSVKFVQSPYKLELISTPPFIKPRLPYTIQVLVRDHLWEPVSRVPLRLRDKQSHKRGGVTETMNCGTDTATTNDKGIALFYCSIREDTLSISLQIVTEDRALPPESQGFLPGGLRAESYNSPNARYLYIDPSPIDVSVGGYAQVTVYSVGAPYLQVKTLNYLIMSKGKVVKFDSIEFVKQLGGTHTLRFQVTPEMVPSIRLLVYYMPYGEGTSELVADAVWLNIQGACVDGLEVEMETRGTEFQPREQLYMNVKANQDGYIAMAAVDTAIYSLRPNYKDPVDRVLRHLESADQGCGGGGGRDAADVFRLAGLSFMTNANSGQTPSSAPCDAVVRPKRAIPPEKIAEILAQYPNPHHSKCCHRGMEFSPTFQTCEEYADSLKKRTAECREAFKNCCLYIQRATGDEYYNSRSEMGGDFGKPPSLVRSDFPESWLWQTRNIRGGSLTLSETLPDSLTTWHIKTVGMFNNGICVAKTVKVSVNKQLSVNVPLPYQMVRGEQIILEGSVYNQLTESVQYCVTLSVVPELCLVGSEPATDGSNYRSTACTLKTLPGGEADKVQFTVMALEAGQHQLNFSLSTLPVRSPSRVPPTLQDKLVKTLTVVPEGRLYEDLMGGHLDPQALYGSKKFEVVLRSALPKNIVPNTEVQRMLSISGEILDKWVSVVDNPEALEKLLSLRGDNVKTELNELRLILHVYNYLEATGRNTQKAQLQDRIRQGVSGVSMFKRTDFSYSMFKNQDSSTWVTALIVQILAKVKSIVKVDLDSLAKSVDWLIDNAQNADGSFRDNSLYKPNNIMKPSNSVDKSVYLTSFVIIALHEATKIKEKRELQLKSQENSIQAAIKYVSRNIDAVRNVYAVSVAAYALTLHDPDGSTTEHLLRRLENEARQRGNPPDVRYWTDTPGQTEWIKPDQSSGQTMETTAYALLSFLLKARIPYCTPIILWLTQDQHYGGGQYGVEDTLMTLEAMTLYSQKKTNEQLDQRIVITAPRDSSFQHRVHLTKKAPVSSPIQIPGNTAVLVRTANTKGVSQVTLKTVFYQTIPPQENCNFIIKLELLKYGSIERKLRSPYLTACAQYTPPPDEAETEESMLTVMEIELPTGIEPFLDDLRPLKEDDIVASYRLNGRTVVINIYAVPADRFLCVGFRIRTAFVVGGTSDTVFTVYEDNDPRSKCTKQVSDQEQKIHRLCQYNQCQCITAVCSLFRGTLDPATIAKEHVKQEICPSQVKYAFKVIVKSIASEGDFSTISAEVVEVVKQHPDFDAVTIGTEVDFIKKTTCDTVDLQRDQQYLIFGAAGLEVVHGAEYRYRFPLDSEAVIQIWPTDCTNECSELAAASYIIQSGLCPRN